MKIIGIGLNKTGTKTLRHYLLEMGYNHKTYDLDAFRDFQSGNWTKLFETMNSYDSFEDWPWPLFYKKIDEKYPDALFILTVRKNPEVWYQSLCKMAVRIGPFNDFEKHIYGYSMPHGRKKEHLDIYNKHIEEVENYFKSRPNKLLKICWGNGDDGNKVANFLGKSDMNLKPEHINMSHSVYSGDNLWLAHFNKVVYQSLLPLARKLKNVKNKVIK